jgi:hypothetical protein
MRFQQGVEWSLPEAAVASGFATSAFMDLRLKARHLDPVGSFGASVGPDHRETGTLPFTDEFIDAGVE